MNVEVHPGHGLLAGIATGRGVFGTDDVAGAQNGEFGAWCTRTSDAVIATTRQASSDRRTRFRRAARPLGRDLASRAPVEPRYKLASPLASAAAASP